MHTCDLNSYALTTHLRCFLRLGVRVSTRFRGAGTDAALLCVNQPSERLQHPRKQLVLVRLHLVFNQLILKTETPNVHKEHIRYVDDETV